MKLLRLFLVSFFLVTSVTNLKATHIAGGEITYRIINPTSRTFEIFIIGYVDLINGQVTFGGGTLDFGDGSEPIIDLRNDDRVTIILDEEPIENGTGVGISRFRMEYSYKDVGNYIISYTEPNRNGGILNMNNSVETPFYIESLIIIDTDSFENNSATILIPPQQYFCKSSKVHIPLGVYDIDGDSLSYVLRTPKLSRNKDVDGYKLPNDPSFYSNPSQSTKIQIDAFGNLSMFSPSTIGEYVLAIWITEWRIVNGEAIVVGKTLRDFMVGISDDCTDNLIAFSLDDPIVFTPGISFSAEYEITNSEQVESISTYNDLLESGSFLTSSFTGHSVIIEAELGCKQLSHANGFITSKIYTKNQLPPFNSTSSFIIDPVSSNCSFLKVEGNTKILVGQNLNVILKNTGLKPLEISKISPPDGITVSFSEIELTGESEVVLDIFISDTYDGNSSIIKLESNADGGDNYILLEREVILDIKNTNKWITGIYPNPSSSDFYIESKIIFSKAIIYDLDGIQILIQKLVDQRLNLEKLSSGTYIVELIGRGGSESHRFVKK